MTTANHLFSALIVLTVLMFSSQTVDAQSGPPEENTGFTEITIKGSRAKDASYLFSIDFLSRDAPGMFDAIVVRSLPSNTLLFAHIKNMGSAIDSGLKIDILLNWIRERALSTANGLTNQFLHQVTLPYDPLEVDDSMISVEVLYKGLLHPVAQVSMQLDRSISFSTYTLATELVPIELLDISDLLASKVFANPVCSATQRCHCCDTACGNKCVCCEGARFTCDVSGCDIFCGWENDIILDCV